MFYGSTTVGLYSTLHAVIHTWFHISANCPTKEALENSPEMSYLPVVTPAFEAVMVNILLCSK